MASTRAPRRCSVKDCPLQALGPHYAHHANAKTARQLAPSAGSPARSPSLPAREANQHSLSSRGTVQNDPSAATAGGASRPVHSAPASADAYAIDSDAQNEALDGRAEASAGHPDPNESGTGDHPGQLNAQGSDPPRSHQPHAPAPSSGTRPAFAASHPALPSSSSPTGLPSRTGSPSRTRSPSRTLDLDGSIDPALLSLDNHGSAAGSGDETPNSTAAVDGAIGKRSQYAGGEAAPKRKKARHGEGKKTLARLAAIEKSAARVAAKPRSRSAQVKSHAERMKTMVNSFEQSCRENGTFGILLLAHPHHLGRKKSSAIPYYQCVTSAHYESVLPSVPTEQINLSALLPGSDLQPLPPHMSPDTLVTTIESLFSAHVQQIQERELAFDVSKLKASDEMVRAANERADKADRERRKMKKKLNRVLAQVDRRRKRRGSGSKDSSESEEGDGDSDQAGSSEESGGERSGDDHGAAEDIEIDV